MALSKQSTYTFIICGDYKYATTIFDDQSTIDQIHEQVRHLCGPSIPKSFCLTFYHTKLRKHVKLNQNELNSPSNPFRFKTLSVNNQDIRDIVPTVDLYVVDTLDENDTPSGILCTESNSVDTINEIESQQDVPIRQQITNNNEDHTEDSLDILLGKEIDINTLMPNVYTNGNGESLPTCPIDNQSGSNDSSNNTLLNNNEPENTSLSDAILMETQSIHVLQSQPSEPIATGVAVPTRTHPTAAIQSQPSVELNEVENPDRLYFSLDVKPEQKDIYKSDQFNQEDQTKTNGYIAHVQGIKTPAQKMSSVWPKVHIPTSYRKRPNIRLVVFVVSERLENGMRIWCKHRDKRFLPVGFTRDSSSVNPIEFDINENNLTIEGDFKLDLQMTTLWDKLTQPRDFYKLSEQSTIALHPAEHDSLSPRLLCVLKNGSNYDLNTICLSDFIRKKASKRSLTTNTINTVLTNEIVRKRARAK